MSAGYQSEYCRYNVERFEVLLGYVHLTFFRLWNISDEERFVEADTRTCDVLPCCWIPYDPSFLAIAIADKPAWLGFRVQAFSNRIGCVRISSATNHSQIIQIWFGAKEQFVWRFSGSGRDYTVENLYHGDQEISPQL